MTQNAVLTWTYNQNINIKLNFEKKKPLEMLSPTEYKAKFLTQLKQWYKKGLV